MPKHSKTLIGGLFCCFLAFSSVQAETLKVGGTGAALGTMSLLAESFEEQQSDIQVEVLPSIGSGGAIKAVAAGSLSLGLSSRPLKSKEEHLELRLQAYASTPLVFVSDAQHGIDSLSVMDVIELFQRKRVTWPDGSRVRPILRPPSDGDNKIVIKFIPGLTDLFSKASKQRGIPVAYNDQEAVDMINRLRGGFGISSLSLLRSERRNLHIFPVDNVEPSPASLMDKRYPFEKTLYLVLPAQLSDAVEKFIAFIFSNEGHRILSDNGNLVITKTTAAQ